MKYLEKLLDGAEVAWLPLGDEVTLRRGQVMSKGYLVENQGVTPDARFPTSGRDFTLRARIWECKESMPSTPGTTPSPLATTPQRCHCRASWQS